MATEPVMVSTDVANATDGRTDGDRETPLAGAVLHGSLAHARIAGIDARRAKTLPGVVAVLISDDILDTDPYHGLYLEDRPLMAIDRVRFAGEPVAAVAAEDAAVAAHALTLIDVAYEERPAALTIEAVLADGAPRLHVTELLRPGILHDDGVWHGLPGNVCWRQTAAHGDVAAALAGADVVVEGEYRIEPEAATPGATTTIEAAWSDDGLTLWTTAAAPLLLRAKLARIFDLPLAQVRVVRTDGREASDDGSLAPVAAALARKARRPVRLAEATVDRPDRAARIWMRTAATADGRLVAREVRVDLDVGAFAGDQPLRIDPGPVLGPYRWRAVAFDVQAVYTNTPPGAAASPLLPMIGELQVDEVARRLGDDAGEVRARNLIAGLDPVSVGRS